MKTIYKYEISLTVLDLAGRATVLLPCGSRILSVQDQGGALCLWAEVDPDKCSMPRYFTVVETGGEVPNGNPTYLATVQMGSYVWHVYEV
jgi:hypothetical protein